jgi:hypothetical protein
MNRSVFVFSRLADRSSLLFPLAGFSHELEDFVFVVVVLMVATLVLFVRAIATRAVSPTGGEREAGPRATPRWQASPI